MVLKFVKHFFNISSIASNAYTVSSTRVGYFLKQVYVTWSIGICNKFDLGPISGDISYHLVPME